MFWLGFVCWWVFWFGFVFIFKASYHAVAIKQVKKKKRILKYLQSSLKHNDNEQFLEQ